MSGAEAVTEPNVPPAVVELLCGHVLVADDNRRRQDGKSGVTTYPEELLGKRPQARYLERPLGEVDLSIMKMARQGLCLELQSAVHEAKKKSALVRREGGGAKQHDNFLDQKRERPHLILLAMEDVSDGKGQSQKNITGSS